MHSFKAVAIVVRSILLSSGANASAGVAEANNLLADAKFQGPNVAEPDLFQAGQDPQTDREDELLAAIVSARISEPDRVAGVLNDLRVESTSHLGRLDLEEWSEMMAEMRRGGVALGDRNKLRLLVATECSRSRTGDAVLSSGQRRVQAGLGDEESGSRAGRQGDSPSAAQQPQQASEQESSSKPEGTIFGVSGDSTPNIPVTRAECT